MATPWDRLGSRVKRAGRSEEAPDEHGWRACKRLGELDALSSAVDSEIDREIIRAREQGMGWDIIGASLRMTKQGAQHRWRAAMTRTGAAEPTGSNGGPARTMHDLTIKHAGQGRRPAGR